jgi:hypothetical protein
MVPCILVMMLCTIAKPRPVPLPTPLVVKKGSKIRGKISGGIPLPLSCTSIPTKPSGK